VRVAAVDCGTNSIRLLVADLDGSRKVDVHREMRVVRLGQGVDRTGVLAPEALERTRVAMADYAEVCRDLGVERTRFVATSATRDAANRDVFVDLVQQTMGVPPEVVSGDEEADLSFLGASAGLDPADGPFLVMDIGGGSTELVLGTEHAEAARSVDVGCVRLTERHLHDDPPTAEQVAAARADVDVALDLAAQEVPVAKARTAVGLAGSVTTVAALALRLPAYDPQAIHLSRIPVEQVREVTLRLLAMTRAERAALPVMHPGRVDVIGGGALVLLEAMERFGLPEVLVSETDILDGIALSQRRR
jgi:exopolyphosphatase/guanosine-5'-triphosphate,3'-diphosphate pyrophosphatase